MAKTDHHGKGVERRHDGIGPGGHLGPLQEGRQRDEDDKWLGRKALAKNHRRQNTAHLHGKGRKEK